MAMECTELQGSGLRIEVARASAARGEDIGVRGVKQMPVLGTELAAQTLPHPFPVQNLTSLSSVAGS